MNARTGVTAICAVLQIGLAYSQSPVSSAESLKVIGDFADRLCQTVPLTTSSDRYELSGAAKAELDGLVRKLAGLGISGAAKYESTNSQNVLQSDLARVLKDSRDCRLQIWNDLKGKFSIGSSSRLDIEKEIAALDIEIESLQRRLLIVNSEIDRAQQDYMQRSMIVQRLNADLVAARQKGQSERARILEQQIQNTSPYGSGGVSMDQLNQKQSLEYETRRKKQLREQLSKMLS